MRILQNPEKYLSADYTSQFSMRIDNYENTVVNDKLHDLIEFEWNDKYSEELLVKENLVVETRDEVILPSRVKYIG